MALRELNLFVNIDNGQIVSGFTSTIPATLPRFVFGDSIPVSVRVLTADTTSGTAPFKEVDLTDKTLRLGICVPGGNPTVGTWNLTFSAETTADLAYNADSTTVAAAINALSSVIFLGGVTVTNPAAGLYRIVFNVPASIGDFTADTSELYPSTAATIATVLEGSVSVREVVLISLETQPNAYVELTDELPAAAIAVEVIRAGDTDIGEIQSIALSPEPYGGAFALEIDGETTGAISFDATAEEVQSAIAAIETYSEAGSIAVTGSFPLYTLSFGPALGAIGAVTPNVAGLIVPKGRKGNLNTNTGGILELLNGEASATATLEIEIFDTDTSTSQTITQVNCTVAQDGIPSSPASQTELPEYAEMTAVDAAIEDAVAESLLVTEREADVFAEDGDILPGDAGKIVIFTNPDEEDVTGFTINIDGSVLSSVPAKATITGKNLTGYAGTFFLSGGATLEGYDSLVVPSNGAFQLYHRGSGVFLLI